MYVVREINHEKDEDTEVDWNCDLLTVRCFLRRGVFIVWHHCEERREQIRADDTGGARYLGEGIVQPDRRQD